MLIRFSSKAGADVLMLQAHAQAVLQAMGREMAPQGIFLPEQMESALKALEAALSQPPAAACSEDAATEDGAETPVPVELRQRAWPLRELLQAARSAGHFVQWQGV